MSSATLATPSDSFTTCGAMLRYLRRRARLTQRDLSIAVGYSEAQISYLEKDRRRPDPAALAALFVPALGLEHEPALAARLLELAVRARDTTGASHADAALVFAEPSLSQIDIQTLETIPPPAPFEVERPRLLARLRARLDLERHVALYGLAGTGKTTLAAALARQYATTRPVFWLTLTEGVTTTVDVLVRQLALFLYCQGQEQASLLLQNQGNHQPALAPDRQIALIGAALDARPALLCLNNIHSVQHDAALMRFLQHILATSRVLVLLTSRSQVPLTGISQIAIDGLERDEGLALVARLAGDTLKPELAQRLVDKTGGSPMLLRLAIGQLLDEQANAETFIERLETLAQVSTYLLDVMLEQLTPPAWTMLTLLSVLRQPVDLSDGQFLEKCYGSGKWREAERAARELLAHHLIDNTRAAALEPVVRDYICAALNADPKRRRRFHHALGEWYEETQGDGLQAAYHFARAGMCDNASDALAACRESLIRRGQAFAAVAILDEILAQVRRQHGTPDLLRRLLATRGYLLSGTLRADESEANYREALALTTNPTVRADLVYELASTLAQRNQHAEAVRLARSAAESLAPTDLLLRARLAIVESRADVVLVQYDQTIEMANRALALTDQLTGVPPPLVAEIRSHAYFSLAEVARAQRKLAVSFDFGKRALAAAQQADLKRDENTYRGYIGGLLYDEGDLKGSFRYRREALAGAQAIGDAFSAAYGMIHLADNLVICLELDEALELLDQAREIFWEIGDMRGLASGENLRATCLITRGRDADARSVVERLLVETEGDGTLRMRGYYLAKLALAHLLLGELPAALKTLERALALPSAQPARMLRFQLHDRVALTYLAAGDVQAAADALAQAPVFEGLSLWSVLDRQVLEGLVALARGNTTEATTLASQVAARAAQYPYYCQRAARLGDAIRNRSPLHELPALIWHLSPDNERPIAGAAPRERT